MRASEAHAQPGRKLSRTSQASSHGDGVHDGVRKERKDHSSESAPPDAGIACSFKNSGKSLDEIGEIRGKNPLGAAFDLLLAEQNAVGVVFNPESIIGKITFVDPIQFPEGIEYVVVNGHVVLSTGQFGRELAGKVLRKSMA